MNSSKSKVRGSAMVTLLGGIVILVSVIVLLAKLANSGYHSEVAQTTESATETRIMPSGRLQLGDGAEPGQRTGQQVFDKICAQCHAADSVTPDSPKITHNDQWTARIAQGFDVLVRHAINGFNTMPARGGSPDLTDDEVARAVAYMANQSGANFTEPAVGAKATADAETASAAATSSVADAGDRGKEVYDTTCYVCHAATSVIPNTPRITKNDEWAPRIQKGKATLLENAMKGFNAMPAKGGNPNLTEADMKAAIDYMVKQSGG
ncbi:c-type cytochrome [Wielerella bovis]|uniref:c-type cytochrome n=1 Tax=Wielerella bovis TaxID=2917790 RepID=UPI002018653D|nr:c-type cytochrome [Wielerella bovis]ULJ65741.1 c-type cytochrome [Wielerella bovis]ULJ66216.1 c-type cytochrome [Wielerella bovis]